MNSKLKEIEIPDYGKVVLKKLSYGEKCSLKGKILQINVDTASGSETQSVNTEALLFWTLVYGIKSLPSSITFSSLPDEKKVDIVSHLGLGENDPEDLGEIIYREAAQFVKIFNPGEVKKKS